MGIVSLAQSIAIDHGTRNPLNICNNYGINVHIHELFECRGYYMKAFDQDYITIASDLKDRIKLFVCAHELGHFLMHQRFNRLFMDYRTYMEPSRFENEADKFALHLLFGGAPMFREPISVYEMSEMMNIPVCNVDRRLIELGIYH